MITFKTANNAAEFCEPKDMGEISYTLTDSYGDGWNGAAINIVDAESGTIIESITMDSGSSAEGTVSLCYGRTVNFVWTAGSYDGECSFTIYDPDGVVIASKTTSQSITGGSTFASYTMTMPNPTESLDFGVVDVNTSKTLSAYIKNDSNNDVNATLTATTPFSVVSTSVTMQPGISRIPVTFTPTDARNYNGTLIVQMGDVTTTITLKGVGSASGPEAVRDEAFFEGITYTWTDDEGTHTSNLAEVATKPEQIIALLKEVYTNQDIPGNLKRGFTASGGTDTNSDVSYSGVGSISRSSSGAYSYSNSLGWDIPNKTSFKNTTNNNYTFTYMDPTDYKPNVEGVTLLLIESADDYDLANYEWPSSTGYDYLKSMVATTIKSARVVTSAKRSGEGLDRGTMFKVDCDKMNKFFLLAKGQLRWLLDSYYANTSDGQYIFGSTACPEPAYMYYRRDTYGFNGWHDGDGSIPLFSHMFEQFSPVNINTGENIDDLYQSLVNMQSFGVYHDCISVPFAITTEDMENEHGHQFMMYGLDSGSADCQDVRDLMFFVPDYRMLKDDDRDNGDYQRFLNYNTSHQPKMALFVIKQNPITGEQVTGQDTYKLHLTWTSNLLDFLPGEDGMYTLYRVITNDDGTKTYEAVGEFDPNTFDYDDYVPMLQTGQQVTYVVRGQDVEKFLSLQMSNEESYIIPGLDPSELVLLEDATHYSRFDAQRVRNCYSNKLIMSNNVDGIKQANLTSSTQLIITREAQGATEPTTIATVTFNPSSKQYTVQMSNQAQDATEFPKCVDGSRAGYHANNGNVTGNGSWTGNYTVNTNGDINLGTLEIFDNFIQAIPDDNTHPNGYMYNVSSNYECPATSVYLNAANCTNGDEIWYAWTYNNQSDGKWVMGTMQGNLLKFAPAKNNIIFVRMNPNATGIPRWNTSGNDNAVWNQTGDLSTVGYIGKTFTVNWGDNGSMYGSWSNTSTPDMAHSNAFRIPIYKTSSQINGSFGLEEVDGDTGGALGLPENIEFGVGVQLSSKSEILRYDTYRWGENEDRYLIAWADGDDEQDLPPTGLAMNQGEYYTISMNPDTDNETNGEASVASGSGTATFVDEVPGASTNAAAFTYAPVVEAFSGRGDYNTYGGPLQGAAVGKVNVEVPGYEISTYSWKKGDDRYAYYNVELRMTQDETPIGYEIYRVRAWREMDTNLLDEPLEQFSGRKVAKYLFEDMKGAQEEGGEYQQGRNMVLGAQPITILDDQGNIVPVVDNSGNTIQVYRGTFGARKVTTNSLHGQDQNDGCVESLDMNFKVRIYFTKANSSKADGEDSKQYYIVEKEYPFTINGGIPTGIVDVMNAKQIVSEKYYNVAGIESDTPFQGVNIVVTRYSDGSTTTTKILK